jgi:hypothetical protein
VDRLVVLRAVKRMGHLLDSEGRATGTVRMDVWRDPVPGDPLPEATLPGEATSAS